LTFPREAAILTESRPLRELIRISEVSLRPTDPGRLRGGSLDLPRTGSTSEAGGLEVAGWALLEESGAGRAEFLAGGTLRGVAPLEVRRLDVYRHFGSDPDAEFCGFQGWIAAGAADGKVEVDIVRDDGLRIPFAVISLESGPPPGTPPDRSRPGGIILMYHRIANITSDPWSLAVDPAHFAEQMDCLRKEFVVVPLARVREETANGSLARGAVAVTFDDGYADNLSLARPILERFEIPATVFVTTGALGASGELWWDELDRILLQPGRLPETLDLPIGGERFEALLGPAVSYGAEEARRHRPWRFGRRPPGPRQIVYGRLWDRLFSLDSLGRRRAMDSLRHWAGAGEQARPSHRTLRPDEALQLEVAGLIELGAHTVSHPALSRLPADAQRIEIEASASALEKILHRRPRSFAYPFGDFDEGTPNLLREAGFREAVTTAGTGIEPAADPLLLPRIQVCDWEGDEFAGRLTARLAESSRSSG
jgi:peptidoglycan/xylan/chitin deacetylase (PgdA/CDA1 family)